MVKIKAISIALGRVKINAKKIKAKKIIYPPLMADGWQALYQLLMNVASSERLRLDHMSVAHTRVLVFLYVLLPT